MKNLKHKKWMSLFVGTLIALLFWGISFTSKAENENSDENEELTFKGRVYYESQLSTETLEWLNWYNGLSFSEKEMISHEPYEIRENQGEVNAEKGAIIDVFPDVEIRRNLQFGVQASSGAPVYNPSYWNDPSRITKANCYAYAMDVLLTYDGLLQPGYLSGQQYTMLIESDIYNAVVRDGPYLGNGRTIRRSTSYETPGVNEYKVALAIAPGRDYHWYVLNSNGYWSHKRGHTSVSNLDAGNNPITNPQTCNRNYGSLNYSTFCGYYIVGR